MYQTGTLPLTMRHFRMRHFRMRLFRHSLFGAVVAVVGFVGTIGIEGICGSGGNVLAQDEVSTAIDRWVAGLGSEDYLMRVKSEEQLLRIGRPAIKAVGEAVESPDIEVEIRARRLLATLIDQDFEVRKTSFLAADKNSTKDFGFSRWKEFRSIAGQSKRARQLFVDIMELHRKKSSAAGASGVAGYLGYLNIEQEQYTPLPSNAVEVADELLKRLTSLQRKPVKKLADGVMAQQLMLSGFEANLPRTLVKTVNDSEYAEEIQSMIAHWIRTTAEDQNLTHNQIEIIYKFELLGFADKLAKALRDDRSEVRLQAAEAIARVGGTDAVELLKPFLASDEVVAAYSESTTGTSIQVSLGDYVFQLLLSRQEKPLEKFGLLATAGTMRLSDTPVYGFVSRESASDAKRQWETDQ